MLDLEHSKVVYSDTFINLTEGTTEYYDKKIEGNRYGKIKYIRNRPCNDIRLL